jgi:hypothetical protein
MRANKTPLLAGVHRVVVLAFGCNSLAVDSSVNVLGAIWGRGGASCLELTGASRWGGIMFLRLQVCLAAALCCVIVNAEDALTVVSTVVQNNPNEDRVGIGTAAPSQKLDVNGNITVPSEHTINARYYPVSESYQATLGWDHLQLGNTGNNYIVAGNTGEGGRLMFVVNNSADLSGQRAVGHFSNNAKLAMTIETTGTVAIGSDAGVNSAYSLWVTGLAYVTGGVWQSSDYRLKQNVAALSNSLDRVMRLKPYCYSFKARPGHIEEGFLAHELQEVIPAAVNGVKDAVDENNMPIPQAVSYAQVVPTLTAALQELKVENDKVKAENAKLSDAVLQLTKRLAALEEAQKPKANPAQNTETPAANP